ncbi:MAG TPA: dTDP-4-dehydrorhamnose 3,5-epimerase family protein [Burkholderiaceae bacterium]|nr:dTDP-4-dehydrorhamnose 3,5-epimerase family protein [Burkholderiaceae bacterium]
MKRFTVTDTPIAGLKLVQRQRLGDERGSFERVFCGSELAEAGWTDAVVQVNISVTAHRGTVRGLHFQHPPGAEMKLVSCLRGEVWDVALDLRRGSPTFLQWHAQRLSPANGLAMLIPRGCAHGFQTLADDTQMLYFHTADYAPGAEGAVNPLDPCVAVAWPLPITVMSERDKGLPMLPDDFSGVST